MNSPVVSKKALVWVWVALLLLLFLTWGLAQFDLHHFNAVVALSIAVLKMLLVILIFMHVRYKPPLTWIFVAAGFIWLLIMVDLTLSDYMSRGAVPGNPDKSWEHGAWPAPSKEQPRLANLVPQRIDPLPCFFFRRLGDHTSDNILFSRRNSAPSRVRATISTLALSWLETGCSQSSSRNQPVKPPVAVH